MVCIFDPACELLPPWTKEGTILVYCCPYLLSDLLPPPPLPNVQYMQTVCDCGGVLKCTVDHILQEFYTLFLTRARICKRLRRPGIDSEDSIPPTFVAWQAGTTNRVVVPARQAGNRFLGSLKGLQLRALIQNLQNCFTTPNNNDQ
jgi:hypothetical protein